MGYTAEMRCCFLYYHKRWEQVIFISRHNDGWICYHTQPKVDWCAVWLTMHIVVALHYSNNNSLHCLSSIKLMVLIVPFVSNSNRHVNTHMLVHVRCLAGRTLTWQVRRWPRSTRMPSSLQALPAQSSLLTLHCAPSRPSR